MHSSTFKVYCFEIIKFCGFKTNLEERILSIFDFRFRSEWIELPRWFRCVILTLLGGFWRFKDDVNIDGRASLQQHHTTAAKKEVTMFLRLHAVLASYTLA